MGVLSMQLRTKIGKLNLLQAACFPHVSGQFVAAALSVKCFPVPPATAACQASDVIPPPPLLLQDNEGYGLNDLWVSARIKECSERVHGNNDAGGEKQIALYSTYRCVTILKRWFLTPEKTWKEGKGRKVPGSKSFDVGPSLSAGLLPRLCISHRAAVIKSAWVSLFTRRLCPWEEPFGLHRIDQWGKTMS